MSACIEGRRYRSAPSPGHAHCNAFGVTVSVHGPVLTQLGELPDDDRERLVLLLAGEDPGALVADSGAVLRGGCVEGPLISANLEVLRSLVGTRFMPSLAGCVLAPSTVQST